MTGAPEREARLWLALLGGWRSRRLIGVAFLFFFALGAARMWVWPLERDRDGSDKISEGYVVGGVKHYKVTGEFFSSPLGRYIAPEPYPFHHIQKQYDDFPGTALPEGVWVPYTSRSGVGGLAFRSLCALQRLGADDCRLTTLKGINLLVLVAVVSLMAALLSARFGLAFSLPFAFVIFQSSWVSGFSENLYWMIWIYLVPALPWAVALLARDAGMRSVKRAMAWYFAATAFFFLIGFEFTTIAISAALSLFLMNLLARGAELRQLLVYTVLFLAVTLLAFFAVFFLAHDLGYMMGRIALNAQGTQAGLPAEIHRFTLYWDAFLDIFPGTQQRLFALAYVTAMGVLCAAALRKPGTLDPRLAMFSFGFLVALSGPVLWTLAMLRHAFIHYYIIPFAIDLFAAPFAAGFLAWMLAWAATEAARRSPRFLRRSSPAN